MKFVIQEQGSSNGGPKYYLRLDKEEVLKRWGSPEFSMLYCYQVIIVQLE